MKKVLVTGSAGFLGQAVMEQIKWVWGDEPVGFDLVDGQDIMAYGSVTNAVAEVDAVIHLAGVLGTDELFDDVWKAVDVNLKGGLNVVQAVHDFHTPVLVIISQPHIWTNPYEATKGALIRIARGFEAQGNFRLSVCTVYNAYGPGPGGHPSKLIPKFSRAAWKGEPLEIIGDGMALVDLVHLDDVAVELVRRVYSDFAPEREGAGSCPMTVEEVAVFIRDYVRGQGGPTSAIEFGFTRRGETEPGGASARHPCAVLNFDQLRDAILSYKPE